VSLHLSHLLVSSRSKVVYNLIVSRLLKKYRLSHVHKYPNTGPCPEPDESNLPNPNFIFF